MGVLDERAEAVGCLIARSRRKDGTYEWVLWSCGDDPDPEGWTPYAVARRKAELEPSICAVEREVKAWQDTGGGG